MLSGLRTHLMDPALFKEFCAEFTAEINRLRMRGTGFAGGVGGGAAPDRPGAGPARGCDLRRRAGVEGEGSDDRP